MTPPTQTEPPFVPLRHSGWATRRTPWWVFAVLVVVVIGVVVVSLTQKPSQSQRASDLEGYFGDVSTGVGSCAAGLQGSESAYDQVLGGDTAQAKTARGHLHLRRVELHRGEQRGVQPTSPTTRWPSRSPH